MRRQVLRRGSAAYTSAEGGRNRNDRLGHRAEAGMPELNQLLSMPGRCHQRVTHRQHGVAVQERAQRNQLHSLRFHHISLERPPEGGIELTDQRRLRAQ
ncbi:hypothetical protein D3C87_1843220 [compost metagenome]